MGVGRRFPEGAGRDPRAAAGSGEPPLPPAGGDAGGSGPAPRPPVLALAISASLFLGLWGRVAENWNQASAPRGRTPCGGRAPAHLLQRSGSQDDSAPAQQTVLVLPVGEAISAVIT